MQKLRALLLALASVTLALSGCSSSDSAGGFSVTPSATPGTYTFEASAVADNYTWDLGDHLTLAYGKSVTHAYDFSNGNITVSLRARTGAESKLYSHSVVLGSGTNQKSVFLMEGQTDWAVTGEVVKFSASLSRDPENDPLRYSWSCLRTGDAIRTAPHPHPPVEAKDFATAAAGSVTSAMANRTLPAADKTFPGDLCDALGTGTPASTKAATIEGTFSRGGKYTVFLLATDPVHPTVSGSYNFIVTPPGERPATVQTFEFSGKFQAGVSGAAQQLCTQATLGSCDAFDGFFSLPLNGAGGNVTLTYTEGPGETTPAANKVSWSIKRGDTGVATGGGVTPQTVDLNVAHLTIASFKVHVQLDQGRETDWTLTVVIPLNMDPTNVY